MPSKKSTTLFSAEYKYNQLKKAKLLPKGYPREYSKTNESQKRQMRRQWQKHKEVASAPEKFHIISTDKKRVKKARDTGFDTHGTKIFVPLEDKRAKTVKVTLRGDTIFKVLDYGHQIKTIETPLVVKESFFERLAHYKKHRPLRRNEFITVRVESASPFATAHQTYGMLEKYVSNWFPKDYAKYEATQPGKGEQIRTELIDRMEFVHIDFR